MIDDVNWNRLIAGWNAGDKNCRDELIEGMMPFIKKRSVIKYDESQSVNTPLYIFSGDDDALQDLYEHFLVKAPFTKFEDKNDVLRFFSVTTHRFINDKIKVNINNARPGYRIPLNECKSVEKIKDYCVDSSQARVEMEEALSKFVSDKNYKDQATAFCLVNLFNQSVESTAEIMEINERTVYRYLEVAKLKLYSLITSNDRGNNASF